MKTNNVTISFKTTSELNSDLEAVSSMLSITKSELMKRLIMQGLKPLRAEIEPIYLLKQEFRKAVELSDGWVTEKSET